MKTNLKVLLVLFTYFTILPNNTFGENWEVKKVCDKLGNNYEVAEENNSEGFVFAIDNGFYIIGTIIIPNNHDVASLDKEVVKFQIDNQNIEAKKAQFHSNGKEIDISLNEEDIKELAHGQIVRIKYYCKHGWTDFINFNLQGACIALSSISDSSSEFLCNTKDRQHKLAKELTGKLQAKGWKKLVLEVHERDTISIINQKVKQKNKLSKDELTGALCMILKPEIVSKLKRAGFKHGIYIDGNARRYPFEISTRYYDEIVSSMKSAIDERNR